MIRTFIPSGELPATKFAGVGTLRWLRPDSEDRYRRNPHPLYGPDDVAYEFNSKGYRCAELDRRGDLNVLTIGCSWTFGTGLPAEHTWPWLLARNLERALGRSVGLWNLALPGQSNDFISRTLMCALPVLRPDLAVVVFTAPSRREYVGPDGELYNVLVRTHAKRRWFRIPATMRHVVKHYRALASAHQDALNFAKNYKLVELLLNQAEVPWVFTALRPRNLDEIAHVIDRERYLGFGVERIDLARDHMHPGPESQRVFAERLQPVVQAL